MTLQPLLARIHGKLAAAAVLLLALAALPIGRPALAAQPAATPPDRCRPRAEDYTYMWWAHGLRGRSADGKRLRAIRTGRYGLAVDVETADVVHLGPIAEARSYDEALTESNAAVLGLPAAKLDLAVEVGGTTYRSAGTAVRRRGHEATRIIDSGRLHQRFDILGLEFAGAGGKRLAASGRLEVAAWPDRLALLLEVEPTGQPAGDWKEAAATIRLAAAGRTFSARGTKGEDPKRTASLVLGPDLEQDPQPSIVPPLEVAAVDPVGGNPCAVSYDPFRGCFCIDTGRVVPRGEHNDSLEQVKLRLGNPTDRPQVVRLVMEKGQGGFRVRGIQAITGMSPMLRDAPGNPLGIPVQISKNWHKRQGRPVLYEGPWFHGYTMLNLPPRSRTECEFTLAYAHWGGVPAASHAQLCLIGWGSNQLWEQAAVGAWGESICFEPDQAQAESTVLDTRPLMVWIMGRDTRDRWGWTNNVGGADFLACYDPAGARQWQSRMRRMVRRSGPNLTEVTYAGHTADGRIDLRATVGLCRTDDLVRGLYRFRYDVRRPVAFSRLVLFQAGADGYSYTGERRFALGNETGLLREWATQWGGNAYKTPVFQCPGRVPWLSMHEAASRDKSKAGAWANRGLVIRRWDARLGGKPAPLFAAERGAKVRGADTSLVDILPPPDVTQLLPGDYVEAELVHVVVPQKAGDYYGPNQNLREALARDADTWRMIHREAMGNDLKVAAQKGRVLRRYPVDIEVDADGGADFTVTGGLGYVPVTLAGLARHDGCTLVEIRDGQPRAVDQSVHGNDFWQTDFDASTRRYSRTYTLPLDTPGDRPQARRFVLRPRPTE